MQEQQLRPTVQEIDARDVYQQLRRIKVFSEMREDDASCLGRVRIVHAPVGSVLFQAGEKVTGFWGVLQGEIRGFKKESDDSDGFALHFKEGESFGEVPLLMGRPSTIQSSEIVTDTVLIGVGEEGFWKLLATCPVVRKAIVSNMERRLQSYQAFTLHREKLMSLGTLAAGLMHELNNPGTAARRAAAQLRENLVRLQQISMRFCEVPLQGEQVDCMKELQQRALSGEKPKAMNSLDQSDAEESLAEWLDGVGVENSWKMAPTLTAIGLTGRELECTQNAFRGSAFSDALNWLVSLISSMQLVETIEESITRVSDLVMAVKKYSYNENGMQTHAIDIKDGLVSTITILGHKFRTKDLKIDKQFSADLPVIQSCGVGLAQVWTNLLDNAIDASPERGTIHVRAWAEGENVCVGIADEGAGIPEENQSQIFSAFFTTKPVGVGTGLGLDIAQRIVVASYGGQIHFTSEPGKTEFIVRLPVLRSLQEDPAAACVIAT